jgi:hypothetical protein
VDQRRSDQPHNQAQRSDQADVGAGKNPAAVELGRRGGLKGGAARAAKLTAEERSASARKAATARWAKSQD